MTIRLLRPTTGPFSDTFADHAARYPARVAVGNYAYCGQDFGRRSDHDTAAEDRRIVASHSGTITVVLGDRDYGNYVTITSPFGFKTRYAHLARVDVTSGQAVAAGQQIGVMGDTGNAAGIHLHHELIVDGMQTDPAPYYVDSLTDIAGDTTELITPTEDDMIVKRIRRNGIGEHYLFVSPTTVSLSRELSTLAPADRDFEDRVATAINGGQTPDFWDETPNGSWYLRNQLASRVAGMPTDYPLSPTNPYRPTATGGPIKTDPPAQVNADTLAAALANNLAARLAN